MVPPFWGVGSKQQMSATIKLITNTVAVHFQIHAEPSCELGSAAVPLVLAGTGAECQKTTVCSHAVQAGFPSQ